MDKIKFFCVDSKHGNSLEILFVFDKVKIIFKSVLMHSPFGHIENNNNRKY